MTEVGFPVTQGMSAINTHTIWNCQRGGLEGTLFDVQVL